MHGASVESGDIGGVDRMGEVADGEHAGGGGRLPCVDEGAARVGVDLEVGGAGQFVVGDPVAGEDDGVAVDRAARVGVEVLDLDRADAALADDAGHSGAGGDGDLERESAGDGEGGVGLGCGVCADHEDGAAACFPECHARRTS